MKSVLLSRRDLDFLLFEWLRVHELTNRKRFAEHSRETFDAVLDLCEQLAARYFATHNKTSDANEPTFDGEKVTIIPEVKEAWDAFAQADLLAMSMDQRLGGAQLPAAVAQAGFAWFSAANVSTTGFKAQRARFSDMLYQTLSNGTAGSANAGGTDPNQIGLGVQLAGTDNIMGQGALTATGNPLDLAIEGQGYFAVKDGSGATHYTRDGAFAFDAQGNLVNPSTGDIVLDKAGSPINITVSNYTTISIGQDGQITGVKPDGTVDTSLPKIGLTIFPNQQGLTRVGDNLWDASSASGAAATDAPQVGSRGNLRSGVLESSNTDLAQEFSNMIVAQRGFEANTKVITAADEILQALGIRRTQLEYIACPSCGYLAYFNPKPVAAVIPVDAAGQVILLRRGFDPGRGLWTFPGGFTELGESVQDAARRETEEELGIAIELGPLVGVYSRATERVVLIVYRALAIGEPQTTPEAVEVGRFDPAALPWGELAFWSTELALRDAFAADVA